MRAKEIGGRNLQCFPYNIVLSICSYEARMRRALGFMCSFALLWGCTSGLPPEKASQESSLSSDSKIIEISIMSPTSWWLRIHRDGSGQVGYGSSFHDFASFSEGTFRFQDLHEKLASICVAHGSIRGDFAVTFIPSEATSTESKYCSHVKLMRRLFTQGIDGADKTGTRVEELSKTSPPVPRNKELKATR